MGLSHTAEPQSVKRPYTNLANTKPPQRRVSLIERSRMMSKSGTTEVQPSARSLFNQRKPAHPPASKIEDSLPKQSENAVIKSKVEKVVIESPSKRRRYSVAVTQSSQSNTGKNQASYTYVPSSDRRMTLNSILQRAMKREENETSLF